MSRLLFLSVCTSLALAAPVVGCNAILGYDAATLENPGVNDAGPGTACANYCSTIMATCKGLNQEYLNTQVCTDMCQQFDPGIAGDTTQNSLACRVSHLAAAQTDPVTGCPKAGPTGAGACGGDPCSEFCALDVALCHDQPSPPYPDENTCDTACKSFVYDAGLGDLAQSAGNTLNCRVYHLESAYDTSDNPSAESTHCPHTAVVSATCN